MTTNSQGDWFADDAFTTQDSAPRAAAAPALHAPAKPLPVPGQQHQQQQQPTAAAAPSATPTTLSPTVTGAATMQQPAPGPASASSPLLGSQQARMKVMPVKKDPSPQPEEPKKHRFMSLFKVCC